MKPILRSAVLDGRRPPCASGTTIAENEFARLYDEEARRKVCALRTRHRFDLGFSPRSHGCGLEYCAVDHTRLVGRLVAYADEEAGRSGSYSHVVVRDALTGRTLRDVQSGSTCSESDQAGPVRSLDLKPDGSMAWVVDACPGAPAPTESHSLGPL